MTDCLKTIQSGLPEESSKGKYLDKYTGDIPHTMLFDAVKEYIFYIKPDEALQGIDNPSLSDPKVLLACALKFNVMMDSFIKDVIDDYPLLVGGGKDGDGDDGDNVWQYMKESEQKYGKNPIKKKKGRTRVSNRPIGLSKIEEERKTIKEILKEKNVNPPALPRMINVINELLNYIKDTKKVRDKLIILNQIKLGLLLEQDYQETDKTKYFLYYPEYNTGIAGGIIPLNIEVRGEEKPRKTQNYYNIANSKYYVGFRKTFENKPQLRNLYRMNVFYPNSFLDKYYKFSSNFSNDNEMDGTNVGYDVVKYEPASFVLNNIYLRLYKNELKLADEIRSHIATTLTQFSENYLNDKDLEDFRNCFIGKYTPKEGDRNIFEYDDNLFLEVENEYEKITDEIILGVKTKYFTQFCTAISESRTQIKSKIATRDMRLAIMLKWFRICYNNILYPHNSSELFDITYYLSEEEVFSLMSQLVNEGKINPFSEFKKNDKAPKSSFFKKIQKIKEIEESSPENFKELKELVRFITSNSGYDIVQRLKEIDENALKNLLIYLVNYNTKRFVTYLLKKHVGREIPEISDIDSDYYYLELEMSKYYNIENLKRAIRFLVKTTEARGKHILLDKDFYVSDRSAPSLGSKIYEQKIGPFSLEEKTKTETPEENRQIPEQPNPIPRIVMLDSINKNKEIYEILIITRNYSIIKIILVLGYKFLESKFLNRQEELVLLNQIEALDDKFYNEILKKTITDSKKEIKLDKSKKDYIVFKNVKNTGIFLKTIFESNSLGFPEKLTTETENFGEFLQRNRFVLQGVILEKLGSKGDIPYVDTIIQRINSKVYSRPFKPQPPELPKRKTTAKPNTTPPPPEPNTTPPPTLPEPEPNTTPPPLPLPEPEIPQVTQIEELLDFENLHPIKQALLYLYLNSRDVTYCDLDERARILRNHNERPEFRAKNLKVINDFIEDLNARIVGDLFNL